MLSHSLKKLCFCHFELEIKILTAANVIQFYDTHAPIKCTPTFVGILNMYSVCKSLKLLEDVEHNC